MYPNKSANMTKKTAILIISVLLAQAGTDAAPRVGETLPGWKQGCLDIHAISQGRGECTFIIMPDGTTMAIDAGEFVSPNKKWGSVSRKPDDSVSPSEVMSRYILHFLPEISRDSLDYMLLTHYHIDHFGAIDKRIHTFSHGYYHTGLSYLYDRVPFRTLIDRSYPEYDTGVLKTEANAVTTGNYAAFVAYARDSCAMKVEKFRIGSGSQITPRHRKNCAEVFCWAANGSIWNGHEPQLLYKDGQKLRENGMSACIMLSYGDFDYFSGGDAGGNTPVEIPLARQIGRKVEAMKANHHMSWNTMTPEMLSIFCPKVIVTQCFNGHQPDIPTLRTLMQAYDGQKHLFFTNIYPKILEDFPEDMSKVDAYDGHIVIRVLPGGKRFNVFVLDDNDFEYRIKAKFGPYRVF